MSKEERKLTNSQFKKLVDMAVSKGGFSKNDTVYLMLTWWSDEFRPLIYIDGNWRTGEKTCVFGDISCKKGYDGLPCGFYVDEDSINPDNVVRRPLDAMHIFRFEDSYSDSNRNFMICCEPINISVDIDPFRTIVVKNSYGENMICLYVDDRDGGEFKPFEEMDEKYIKVIDATASVGKYKYGEWRETYADF